MLFRSIKRVLETILLIFQNFNGLKFVDTWAIWVKGQPATRFMLDAYIENYVVYFRSLGVLKYVKLAARTCPYYQASQIFSVLDEL